MATKETNTCGLAGWSRLKGWSRRSKVLLLLMGIVLCTEGVMAYQQIAYDANPCLIEDGNFASVEGGCKDLKTGRVWSKNAGAPDRTRSFYTYAPAVSYCSNLVEGGYDDWRLPTRDELVRVADNGAGTYLDVFVLQNGDNPINYDSDFPRWSSTTYKKGRYTSAYTVELKTGIVHTGWRTNGDSWTDFVCVR